MNKKLGLILISSVLFLAACGNKDEEKEKNGEEINKLTEKLKEENQKTKEEKTSNESEEVIEQNISVGQEVREFEKYTTAQENEIMANLSIEEKAVRTIYNKETGYNIVDVSMKIKNNSNYEINFFGADVYVYNKYREAINLKNSIEGYIADREFVKPGESMTVRFQKEVNIIEVMDYTPRVSIKFYTANATKNVEFENIKTDKMSLFKENGKYYIQAEFNYEKSKIDYADVRVSFYDKNNSLVMNFVQELNKEDMNKKKQKIKIEVDMTDEVYKRIKDGGKTNGKIQVRKNIEVKKGGK